MKNNQPQELADAAVRKNGRLFLAGGLTAAGFLFLLAIPAMWGDPGGESRAGEVMVGGRAARIVPAAERDADQSEGPTAGALVRAVVANELTDREQLLKWICLIEKRTGKETLTEEQVETQDGPLYRLLAIDGAALNPDQRREDDARIGQLMKDPSPLLKLKQAESEDEIKLQKLLNLMPNTFLYDYDGAEENLVRVKFRPNPDYVPATYEARVIHSLAGTMLIDPERKRMTRIAGRLMNRVEFGYGLLGRIDSGTVELERVEVGPLEWKTAFINIHFSGRVAVFKTISKDQFERRSDFREVASDLSLSEGKELLLSRSLPSHAAALR
ncbi:MAG TPA: hypothetical protein VK728_02570 [Candidatus Sulfotelmatobacter sp.]|jgi:hypothetical protein|nr:hypothetical protein [Candidatus Sulfotelmatobacter sp.]